MHEPSHSKLSSFTFAALIALAIISTPLFAQTSGNAPDGATPTATPTPTPALIESLRPNKLLLEPPTVTLPRNSSTIPEIGEPEPAPAPPQGIASNFKVSERERMVPHRGDRTAIGVGTKYVNAILNGFEQGAGFGFGVEFTSADTIPGIEFRTTILTSTKFYRLFEGSVYIPKIGDDKTHADIWFSYLRRTKDRFFGIGSRSNRGDRTNYDTESRDFVGTFYRDFTSRTQAGLFLGHQSISNYRGQDDNNPPIDLIFSGNPAVIPVSRWLPAFQEGVKLFGYGGYFEYDARNNDIGLTKGGYFYGRLASYDGLDDRLTGDYAWTETQLDGRAYLPLGSDKTSFALRALADLKSPKGGSQIPFYANSFLGGRSFGRGFENFRFRSHNLLLFASELRRTIYARKEDQGADVIVLGDVARSWGDTRSKTDPAIIRNDLFGEAPWRAAFGFGVQFRYNKSLGLRIEYAHSPEKNMVYFSVSRGFCSPDAPHQIDKPLIIAQRIEYRLDINKRQKA